MKISIKKCAACVALGLSSIFTMSAQDMMPSQVQKTENIVREVAPVVSLQQQEAQASTSTATVGFNANFGESVVQTALQYIGASYRSGMTGPYAFDCSGFTSYVYGQQNVSILRSSRSQYTQGTPIACVNDLKKGDLVFFKGRSSSGVGHVGIVMDVDPMSNNFKFVHASLKGVKVSSSDEPYYSRRYVGARRIVEN